MSFNFGGALPICTINGLFNFLEICLPSLRGVVPFIPITLALILALSPTIILGYFANAFSIARNEIRDKSANSFLIFKPTDEIFIKDRTRVMLFFAIL